MCHPDEPVQLIQSRFGGIETQLIEELKQEIENLKVWVKRL
jgi:hypothetical protein